MCGESRYDAAKKAASGGKKLVPRQVFHTIPIGPQLQALWRNPESANSIRYRERRTKEILRSCSAMQGGLTPTMIFFMVGITLKPLLTVGSSLKTWCLCFLLTAHSFIEIRHPTVGCPFGSFSITHPTSATRRNSSCQAHLFLVRTNPKIPSPSSTRVFTTYRHCRKKDFPFGIRHAMFRLKSHPFLAWELPMVLEWSILVDWLVTTVKVAVDCTVHSKDVINPEVLTITLHYSNLLITRSMDAIMMTSTLLMSKVLPRKHTRKIYAICLPLQ